MDLITLIITLAVIGFVLWLLVTYVPMPPPFRTALVVLVVLLVVLWVIRSTGLFVSPRI
jgi:hypothetical protein